MSSIKLTGNCRSTAINFLRIRDGLNLQFVRFRKPRFVPKAKTKIFKVRKPTPIDPVEYKQLKTWQTHYNTEMKSIMSFFRKHCFLIEERNQEAAKLAPFAERFAAICNKNDKWNNATAVLREAEWNQKEAMLSERMQRLVEQEEYERLEMKERAKVKVQKVQEDLDEYITEENLDSKLDSLLDNIVTYDYALYLDGTRKEASSVDERPAKQSSSL
ncbi:probable 28S ribosomal protein S26, mitochondrial [Dreissena polymorpha]|uniref:probable 28S ribosomal protein S26, mitochondrial n=1 Tax=Dreissena polymorpha TaxID=45954 RepID=UPI002263D198|nr:probable 28S ribosomal protein S26, mitochondrial [Dreissena polymorpha]